MSEKPGKELIWSGGASSEPVAASRQTTNHRLDTSPQFDFNGESGPNVGETGIYTPGISDAPS